MSKAKPPIEKSEERLTYTEARARWFRLSGTFPPDLQMFTYRADRVTGRQAGQKRLITHAQLMQIIERETQKRER